ncbi:MAG: discoidin domain-containing protein [Gammaproteobacteria bacterium]
MKSTETCVDNFQDLSGWLPIASGQAEIGLAQETGPSGQTMRLDFDFKQGKGFVVASKKIALHLPKRYAFKFKLRGISPRNRLEFKLLDRSGHNVWWYRNESLVFNGAWQSLSIDSQQIEFAWGPAGGGTIQSIGAIEIALTAIEGGKGRIWFDSLWLEDKSYFKPPVVRASSSQRRHKPDAVFDGDFKTGWRSADGGAQWLSIDFREPRECSGFVIHWEARLEGRSFSVSISTDGEQWTPVFSGEAAGFGHSYLYLPDFCSRHIKFDICSWNASRRIGIAEVEIIEREASGSIDHFYRNIARQQQRGLYPKYLYGEQTYWTIFGRPTGGCQGLINEEGMVEVHDGAFAIEPFLFVDGNLITWADVRISHSLPRGYLPIPQCQLRGHPLALTLTVFASCSEPGTAVYLRYQIKNATENPLRARFFAALRPFQVTPPWQAFKAYGGSSRVPDMALRDGIVWVGRDTALISRTPAAGFGAAGFEQGGIGAFLQKGALPPRTSVADATDAASGALAYDLELAPGVCHEIVLVVPADASKAADFARDRETSVEALCESALREWQAILNRTEISLPANARGAGETFKSSAAYILLNREGSALQPGPRRYRRSWIRDGVVMAAALLRIGCQREAEEYIRWYAVHQSPDGRIPCCVDRDGPDPLAEYDSQGQFIFGVMECYRFTRNRSLLTDLWPAVERAVAYLEGLRSQRLTAQFQEPENHSAYGLLPESVSHEGYLSHPVHSYWDDFWALRGIKDALQMAEILGVQEKCTHLAALLEDFRACLRTSMENVMRARRIDYLPASVELADCDPASTAIAITLCGELPLLSREALAATLRVFFEHVHERFEGGSDWLNYSPYEIRIIAALVRLGERSRAVELLQRYLGDRRPLEWNHWAEIVWRDPKTPGHIGDMPHTWISAEYMLAFRDLFAYERDCDQTLIVAAGIPFDWLDAEDGVAVRDLPTWYGRLGFEIRTNGAAGFEIALTGDITVPPGGIILQPPCPEPLKEIVINGRYHAISDPTEVHLNECPATVTVRW